MPLHFTNFCLFWGFCSFSPFVCGEKKCWVKRQTKTVHFVPVYTIEKERMYFLQAPVQGQVYECLPSGLWSKSFQFCGIGGA